jgi:two-component sensor histidine kinase
VVKLVSTFDLHQRSIVTKDMKSLLRQINRIIDLNISYKELYENLNMKYLNMKNLSELGS